jgi:NADPH:quinone reductase-like Zn-dependent oxidoreductase
MRALKHFAPFLVALTAASPLAARDELPATMQAAAIDHAGGPEVLTVRALPVPKPGAGEVLIAVYTAGVASWDVGVRAHPEQLKNAHFPLVLGTDGAGVIAAVGRDVHGFKVGDQVYSYSWDNPQGGFYAQYVAVPAERVSAVPHGMSLRDAGAMGTTALTALQGVDDALHLKAGETVFIHGAAGGVGTLAVQFAKLRGARVLASVSEAGEFEFVKGLGADAVVDGRHGDVPAAVRAFAPGGLDTVLALASGDALEQAIDALRAGGRVAYPNGVHPAPKPRAGLTIIGYDAVPAPPEYARLNTAIVAAKLRVPIAAEFPLAQAAQAQERVVAGHLEGKVILEVR